MPNGYAMYFEMRHADFKDTGFVTQFLLISPTVAPDRTQVPFVSWTRRISNSKPQAAWSPNFIEPSPNLHINGDGVYDRTESRNSAVAEASSAMDTVMGTIEATGAYDYKMYEAPLIVEVSDIDARSLSNYERPKPLFDRITAVRAEAGWPELPKGAPKGSVTK